MSLSFLVQGILHGLANHVAIAFHVSNDLVFGQQVELALPGPIVPAFEQLADRPKAIDAVTQGHLARPVDLSVAVLPRQALQSDQHAKARHAPVGQHGLAPSPGLLADQARAPQQPLGAPFDVRELPGVNVLVVCAELAGGLLNMHGDLLHLLGANPHQVPVPAYPHAAANVLRRNRVVGLGHLHVPVAMHAALGFLEQREPTRRQRPQRLAFDLLKHLAHLLARCTVDPRVGHRRLPRDQVTVLLGQRGKPPALQGVALDVADSSLDFALVAGRVRLGRKDHRAVMLGKRPQTGIELRVVPVRMLDQGLGIVDHNGLRHPAKVPEGVLEALQQAVGRLPEDRLAVALTRMAQHDPEDVRPAPPPVRADNRRPSAQIDLDLLARRTLHTPHRQRTGPAQPTDVPLDAVVTVAKTMLGHQILVNPLAAEALGELDLDNLSQRLAGTGRTAAPGPGGRVGGTV